jgi:hypothetical protein
MRRTIEGLYLSRIYELGVVTDTGEIGRGRRRSGR